MTPTTKRWSAYSKFEGAPMPRFDSHPSGPFVESMTVCKCGQLWNRHEFATGACPILDVAATQRA